jgi:hypothetical protein
VSLLTRKPPATGYAALGDQARSSVRQARSSVRQAIPVAVNATQQAAPLARQAVPLARNAGMSVKQGTEDAIAWAAPYADAARAWAAPKLEQSAAAVSENLAPMISDALVNAARKIDTRPARQRRRISNAGLLAAAIALIAAGAATALSLRKRSTDVIGYATTDVAGTGESVRLVTEEPVEQDWVDPDANGHPPTA